MSEKDLREEGPPPPRRRRRTLLGNLGKIGRPPFTTPQWKDAIREQEARKKKGERD